MLKRQFRPGFTILDGWMYLLSIYEMALDQHNGKTKNNISYGQGLMLFKTLSSSRIIKCFPPFSFFLYFFHNFFFYIVK